MTQTVGEVARIWRYPIKSTAGEIVESSAVDLRGIVGDRLYAVRDGQGKLGSGKNTRRFRRMDGLLRLSSRYLGDAVDPLLLDVQGRPVPDPAAFLRVYLGNEDLSLVREAHISHLDQLPLSFMTTATLEWLQATLPEAQIDERRFRVNVLVRTPPGTRPFVEDEWLGFSASIGPRLRVSFVKSSDRCTMVNDAHQDLPYSPVILRAITQLHDNKLDALALVDEPGTIELGQLVAVTGRADPEALSGRAGANSPPADVLRPPRAEDAEADGLSPFDVLARFERIRRGTACPFAPSAQLRAASTMSASDSLTSYLAGIVDPLADFVRDGASRDLDGYVVELRGPEYGSTVDLLAATVREVVEYLCEHDPERGISSVRVGDDGWRFRFAGGELFVVTFAPCYEPSNPRWAGGSRSTFFLFQPYSSLRRAHGPGEYDRHARHSVIRDAFDRAGRPYDRSIVDSPVDALKFVKPARLGQPPVRWWQSGRPDDRGHS